MTVWGGLSKMTRQAILLVLIVSAGAAGWLALVAAHDDQGLFGQGSAAWAQAIMSVAAILAAIIIDQGASRRDREERAAIAKSGRDARLMLVRSATATLHNCAKAIEQRTPAPGLVFEGLSVEALRSMRSVFQHYVARGSDDDPGLVSMLCRAENIVQLAIEDLYRRPVETAEQRASLADSARRHAQDLLELADEYQAGLFTFST